MYSRSYYNDAESINLPENYRGEAFSESDEPTPCDIDTTDDKSVFDVESTEVSAKPASILGSIFGSSGLFKLDGIKLPKIGSEELLIIAAALFLLLSKDGDRECGIMLLLLLLIN